MQGNTTDATTVLKQGEQAQEMQHCQHHMPGTCTHTQPGTSDEQDRQLLNEVWQEAEIK